jgi:uncharacterized protein (DUF1778 family)
MIKRTNISVYIEEEDKLLLKRACDLSGMSLCSFLRNYGLLTARQILKENKEGVVLNG